MSGGGHGRLIVVAQADPDGRYRWLAPPRAGDVVVTLDGMADADLLARRPTPFDRLQSWQERSAAERHVTALLKAIGEERQVAAIERRGYGLYEFAEYRLRTELVRCLRGWTLARAGIEAGAGAGESAELICDPALPPAMRIGVRAGLELDPRSVPYALPAALPGPPGRRAVARQLMRLAASASRAREVRVAVVAAGKLALALASLPSADLRSAGVGLMPFPGLDHGNGLLLAVRHRLALLRTYGAGGRGSVSPLDLPAGMGLERSIALDRALALVCSHVLGSAAPELELAARALEGVGRTPELRALLLPSAAYGASRLLIRWARERGLRVGALQHGIYAFREFDGGDRRADVIFGWGEGTAEQVAAWPGRQPRVRTVGVPGLPCRRPIAPARGGAAAGVPRHVLVATSSTVEASLVPAAFCEAFLDALATGLTRLAGAGVEIALRPHPGEEPERYRRMLRARGLELSVVAQEPLLEALDRTDLLVSAASSVAFEAAALGLPVMLWLGGAPRWVREEHLVAPWTEGLPGMFEGAEDFALLIDELLECPEKGLQVPRGLGRELAHYAQPFDAAGFAAALYDLGR